MTLNTIEIPTPLGPMIAVGDEQKIYLLQFADKPKLQKEIATLRSQLNANLSTSHSGQLLVLAKQLTSYFTGTLTQFTIPIHLVGTPFQKKAWHSLIDVPYGTTQSYAQQATTIGNHKAYRAVAHANSCNHIAIVIPCHRIIQSNGTLGGYAGGVSKKEWLIAHEQKFKNH